MSKFLSFMFMLSKHGVEIISDNLIHDQGLFQKYFFRNVMFVYTALVSQKTQHKWRRFSLIFPLIWQQIFDEC